MPNIADWQYAYRNELLKLNSEELFGVMLDANADLNEGFSTYRLWYAEEAVRQVEERLLAQETTMEDLREENSTLMNEVDSLIEKIKALEKDVRELNEQL